jgi:hypothetical protein
MDKKKRRHIWAYLLKSARTPTHIYMYILSLTGRVLFLP